MSSAQLLLVGLSRPIRDLLAPLVLWESFPEDLVAIEALESTAAASIRLYGAFVSIVDLL